LKISEIQSSFHMVYFWSRMFTIQINTGHMPCINLYWFCINVRLKNVLSY
jgi:hypothetical protein